MFWENWSILDDPFVAQILRSGYRLPLSSSPPVTSSPREVDYPPAQIPLLEDNIQALLEKEALEVIPDPDALPGFYSPIFLVPKKNSEKFRMIHNMALFNSRYLEEPAHFKMVSLGDLRSKINPCDWLVSLDLQDAYLHVPIFPGHRRYLRILFRGVHYQWRVLPFGISSAPWLFTRITHPIVQFLHRRGIEFDPYIDDCLMNAAQRMLLVRQRDFALRLLYQLGWIVNLDKSHLEPTHSLVFIGGMFVTDLDLLRVPDDRWEKILAASRRGLSKALKLREWQSILGLMTSAQDLTLRGRLMLRPLQKFLSPLIRDNNISDRFLLPNHLRPYLLWWTDRSNVCDGVSLSEFVAHRQLFVDASLQGWGAHLEEATTSGLWSGDEKKWHINRLEMEAVILAVSHWLPVLRNSNLLIASDNSTVVWTIKNQGTTGSPFLLRQAFRLFRLLDDNHICARARHIPGCRNVLADALSRPDKPSPTEWMLHPRAFQMVCENHHRPLIDLFATNRNNQLPVYVSPLPDPQAYAVDALSMSWEDLDAYAFPPPILMTKVVAKIKTTANLTMILVAPYWPARGWFPALLQLAAREPQRLPEWPHLLRHTYSRQFHPDPERLHLSVWTICRRPSGRGGTQ